MNEVLGRKAQARQISESSNGTQSSNLYILLKLANLCFKDDLFIFLTQDLIMNKL